MARYENFQAYTKTGSYKHIPQPRYFIYVKYALQMNLQAYTTQLVATSKYHDPEL